MDAHSISYLEKNMKLIDTKFVDIWVQQLFDMWHRKDLSKLPSLFGECRHYMEDPFYPIAHSRKEIHALWEEVNEQQEIDLSHEILSLANGVATIRWKCSFQVGEVSSKLDGIYVVSFDQEGNCVKFEQWTVEQE